MTQRLTKEDWLAAGFRALAAKGPAALKAEALARDLGSTKGSFYWHFKDLPAYKSQMLALWRNKAALEIMQRVLDEADQDAQLERLAQEASVDAPDAFGGRAVESAIRAWSLSDVAVRDALLDVDALRTDFIKDLLTKAGHHPRYAPLFYACFIGLDDQAARNNNQINQGLMDLIGLIKAARAT